MVSSSASATTRRRRGWIHGISIPSWRCALLAFVLPLFLLAAEDVSAFIASDAAITTRRPHRHTPNGISAKTTTREGRSSSSPFGFLAGRSSSNNVVCHLFFRHGEVLTTTKSPKPDKSTLRRICEDLSSSSISFPYEANLSDSNKLTIRAVQAQDLTAIAEMCVAEYDSGPSSFPLDNLDRLPEWLDRQALYALVYWTTLVKIVDTGSNSIPNDHAVLVACIESSDSDDDTAVVVGMVEVSRQPVRATRNPPPYPLPMPLKQLLNMQSKQQQQQQLQGWLCNLLVVPEFRGRGLSKLLVAAGEGVVRHRWGCDSMYLHCDADREGDGRVSQRLYASMRYEPETIAPATPRRTTTTTNQSRRNRHDDDPNTSWIPTNNREQKNHGNEDGVVVVEGVPLLYLRKDLTMLQ